MEQFFNIEVDGQLLPARQGQTIAAALMAGGLVVFRRTPGGAARGLFCGMGICFECLVTVDGLSQQRACMRQVQPGMRISLSTDEA
jgi:predicted molibdopterin-dependent oxidoreductase YjgC